MQPDQNIVLLSDGPGGTIGADLDVLYPGKVRRLDITSESYDAGVLGRYEFVITVINDGRNLDQLDYGAVTEFAESGGQVISCLFEYARNRGMQFSKTHVHDRIRPEMRIEVENDVTRGFAVGDTLWWYGTVTSAPDQSYANQMFQRQVLGLEYFENVAALGISNLNSGAVMLEEGVGDGRIVPWTSRLRCAPGTIPGEARTNICFSATSSTTPFVTADTIRNDYPTMDSST